MKSPKKVSNVLGLKIPSAIVPEKFNSLINPESKKLSLITISDARDFIFDCVLKAN